MFSYISSKSNEKIKTVKKLVDKKHRTELGLFIIEGHKLVSEFHCSGGNIARMFLTEEAEEKYSDLISDISCTELYVLPRELYEYISTEQAPQGIMAVCEIPEHQGCLKDGNVLILEALRDAGNLGTVIRTAVALGVDTLVLSSDCADLYNPKTLRATMGALFYANIVVADDICSFTKSLVKSGRKVYASMLSDDALSINAVKFSKNSCIVVGNEGNGISDKLAALCSDKIIIPMQPCAESLNASVAAAILMWELTKDGTK